MALMVLFGVAFLTTLFGAIKTWALLGVIADIPDSGGGFGDLIAVDDALTGSDQFLVLSVLAAIAILILLIIFTYRIHRNIDAFGGTNTRLGHGWAIGGWFVPLANFVLPLLCLMDADQAAHLEPGGDTNIRRARWSKIILVWWLLFSAGYVLNFIGNTQAIALAPEGPDLLVDVGIVDNPTDAYGAYAVVFIGSALLAVAAVVAVKAVHTIWKNQEAQIERLGQSSGAAAPAPQSLVPGWNPTASSPSSAMDTDRSTIAPPSNWAPPPPPPPGSTATGDGPPPPPPGPAPTGDVPPPPPPPPN